MAEAERGRARQARAGRRRGARDVLVSHQPRSLQNRAPGVAADQGGRPGHHRRGCPVRGREVIALAATLVLTLQSAPLSIPETPASPWLRRAPTLLASQSEPAAAQPPGAGDIELLPTPAAPDPAQAARQEELERELQTRRKMLQLHQLGGMLTLASLGATVIFGELNYIDKYGGGGDTGRGDEGHRWGAFAPFAIFAGPGAPAPVAPPPPGKAARPGTAMAPRI